MSDDEARRTICHESLDQISNSVDITAGGTTIGCSWMSFGELSDFQRQALRNLDWESGQSPGDDDDTCLLSQNRRTNRDRWWDSDFGNPILDLMQVATSFTYFYDFASELKFAPSATEREISKSQTLSKQQAVSKSSRQILRKASIKHWYCKA